MHKGQYWQNEFILKKNSLLKALTQRKSVLIDQVKTIGQTNNETVLQVQLNNYTSNARVHVIAQQFQCNFSQSLKDQYECSFKTALKQTEFKFVKWKNMFDSNHVIDDEIRYVVSRQTKEPLMGNTLDRPTLFMKKNWVKETYNDEQSVRKGTKF